MEMGKSDVEIAAEFLVGPETLRSWSETYENFSIAYEIGQAMHEAFYLDLGKRNLGNPMFQTSLFKFLAGNKLGYSDKVESRNFNTTLVGVLKVPGMDSESDWDVSVKKVDGKVINAEEE